MEINIKEILETLKEYLPKLVGASEEIASQLQSGKDVEAIELLQQFLEGLNWVVSVFIHLKKIGYDLGLNSEQLNEFLIQIEKALISKDNVLIADLFEYEISPILSLWLEKVENNLNKEFS
ncbi:hypothetical protein BKP45_06970 [Anaerobacillus alkalidiazotrophicus]|uniref:DUF8042 domain-containing protein n=1 Tax=Anaerobacillus alkalidiazotrophicus TaxID=472963 RepID=A0A1S2MCN5_9BACI|nr:hypothetical protein [Anaerobacillus alkalidiazotrophicus]OIJ22370.1 hypothetical protein BKP45_06970 [Anaerobacillus alkalidiazotrophicus]